MKYELTDETMTTYNGVKLHRIRAIKAFRDVKPGDLGGWVENEANLSHGGNAWACGNAQVFGNAWVCGNAQVFGNAKIYGNAKIFGNAKVFGDAEVFDSAWVYGNAEVHGNAKVFGEARVFGDTRLTRFLSANRSDGYTFTLLPMADGSVRVSAGRRLFSFEEAREHWTRTRGGTPLGDETMLILDYLERASVMLKSGHEG